LSHGRHVGEADQLKIEIKIQSFEANLPPIEPVVLLHSLVTFIQQDCLCFQCRGNNNDEELRSQSNVFLLIGGFRR
jgi:hypothetical protein